MLASEIRKKYLEFFSAKGGSASGGKVKGHAIIPSASLIPENDPSVLFTTAGMHPLVPFLLGEKHPAGKRLASLQKCVRTGDIDEVGDNVHLTFFEMLGNWSFSDYWKEDAIKWSYEFLTDKKWLGLNPERLAVSVFGGDEDCPFDEESYHLWSILGISEARIVRLDKDDNWWPTGGKNPGPQGPDTEMFYWTGQGQAPEIFDPKDSSWVEIWNDVFMQYNRTLDGKYESLKQKNVDTGMGLERTAMVLQGKSSVYEIELFSPIMNYLKSIAQGYLYQEYSARIIADHLRSAIFILADDINIIPSNLKQGYVVRKLIRRAIRHAKKIGIPQEIDLSGQFAELVIEQFKDVYPELLKNKQKILSELCKEENVFEKTLENGLREFNKKRLYFLKKVDDGEKMLEVTKQEKEDATISGKFAFNLYSTYGFPLELIEEEAKNRDLIFGKLQKEEFEREMFKHQDLSRTASAGMFKGGLADHSEMVVKYHTATHLLHQALKDVLGHDANQKGSNITAERLRFDFTHPAKMTPEEIKKVEAIVNQKIQEDLPVHFEEMSVNEARMRGAVGLFGEKYGDKVKVYSIGPSTHSTSSGQAGSGSPYSREICGGPHVEHTGILGHFKIIKEEAVSAGVRRIKAILTDFSDSVE